MKSKLLVSKHSFSLSKRMFCSVKDEFTIINLLEGKDFDEIISKSKVPVVVDFYADWCGPCKRLAPVIEKKQNEKKNFKLVKVNIDNHQDLAEKYDVQGIPFVVLFKNGEKVSSVVGFNEPSLDKMLGSL